VENGFSSSKILRILHLEDDAFDAELIAIKLEEAGITCTIRQVDNSPDFESALEKKDFDIILADFQLGAFDGLTALALVKKQCPRIPFIFISGVMGEDRAIESIKNGATDYVLKDSLSRLPIAINRALHEAEQLAHTLVIEEELRFSQKLEAIGHLAGGIAHDFNNLLTIITSYSQLILCDVSKEDKSWRRAHEIKNASERAATLTAQLLSFSRLQIIQPKVLNINDHLFNLYNILGSLVGESIELVVIPSASQWLVDIDPDQLTQLFMNLAGNARDAMPSGGKLVVEISNITLDKDRLRTFPQVTTNEYVVLTIRDNGLGMSEEVKTHIFEPYFTTKEKGKGTGLGLSSVYGFVKLSGGHIEVFSQVDLGTTFKIYFPRTFKFISEIKIENSSELSKGNENILLVEDEPSLRTLVAEMLTQQGYTVLEAANGVEALEVIKKHKKIKFHLLLTDVIMPLMGGKELADKLKIIRPDSKVLYMSGYVGEAFKMQQPILNDINFLRKPFTLEELTHKIREVLDKSEVTNAVVIPKMLFKA
jgi:two-component system cell cycle sensor histidine kinase/response regulator CckA